MSEDQPTTPEHEPEAESSEQLSPLHAQMQEAARQIKKTKNGMSVTAEDLRVKFSADTKDAEAGIARVNAGIAEFAAKAGIIGESILGQTIAEGIATFDALAAGLDEEDE